MKDHMLEIVGVAESAALACYEWIGRGEKDAADQAAVDAMRTALNDLMIEGKIVIGEGERDEAPMLYIGEEVGNGSGPKVDIALDPLEGTDLTAQGRNDALAVIAFAEKGNLLNAPDVYMDKIAVGPDVPSAMIDLDATVGQNLENIAQAKGCAVSELTVCILDRDRHQDKIKAARDAGAKVKLIQDGDVNGVIQAAMPGSGVDLYVGSGGAPEGVLAAAALQCIGGHIQTRLLFRNDDEKARADKWGITDLDRKYDTEDLAKGKILFAATGVTNGSLLDGIAKMPGEAWTHSVVMESETGSIRYISTKHVL